ncbi:hypothetical protein NC651_036897 [Populus alba x Populus x berolinensis]|nr:hypothetical protein NC651_036897 [Populus alba x Populus x berolinensis]
MLASAVYLQVMSALIFYLLLLLLLLGWSMTVNYVLYIQYKQ